jgi:chemotaxis protein MotB
MAARARRGRIAVDIWPGFVDALATLLMVIMFLLMIFVVSQFYLSEVLSGRDAALEQLNREVAELADLLALEESANEDLQSTVAQLTSELQSTLSDREKLSAEVGSLRGLSNSLTARLAELQDRFDTSDEERQRLVAALAETETLLAAREAALAETQEDLSERDSTLEQTLALLAARNAALDETSRKLTEQEAAMAERALLLSAAEAELEKIKGDLDERTRALEEASREILLTQQALERAEKAYADSAAELTRRMKELEAANKTVSADRETVELQLRKLAELEQDIAAMRLYRQELEEQLKTLMVKTKQSEDAVLAEREISAAAKAQVALLNRQLAELRAQIAALNQALEASEVRDKEQQAQIVDLGKRLNAALAAKVQELARYRSEFFGRLRDVLGDRKDIRIVGDRFVFQSEVLFASGEAELGPGGREQMAALARTLRDLAGSIPIDVGWVLRVDGHTDKAPIRTDQYPSNWELSTARAISVVRFLQRQGIPPERLAATGFGEYQPLDTGETDEAYRRNRRIELKLTQR